MKEEGNRAAELRNIKNLRKRKTKRYYTHQHELPARTVKFTVAITEGKCQSKWMLKKLGNFNSLRFCNPNTRMLPLFKKKISTGFSKF